MKFRFVKTLFTLALLSTAAADSYGAYKTFEEVAKDIAEAVHQENLSPHRALEIYRGASALLDQNSSEDQFNLFRHVITRNDEFYSHIRSYADDLIAHGLLTNTPTGDLSADQINRNRIVSQYTQVPSIDEAANALVRFIPEIANNQMEMNRIMGTVGSAFSTELTRDGQRAHNQYGFGSTDTIEPALQRLGSAGGDFIRAIDVSTLIPYFRYSTLWTGTVYSRFQHFQGLTLEQTNTYLSAADRFGVSEGQARSIYDNAMTVLRRDPTQVAQFMRLARFPSFMARISGEQRAEMNLIIANNSPRGRFVNGLVDRAYRAGGFIARAAGRVLYGSGQLWRGGSWMTEQVGHGLSYGLQMIARGIHSIENGVQVGSEGGSAFFGRVGDRFQEGSESLKKKALGCERRKRDNLGFVTKLDSSDESDEDCGNEPSKQPGSQPSKKPESQLSKKPEDKSSNKQPSDKPNNKQSESQSSKRLGDKSDEGSEKKSQ